MSLNSSTGSGCAGAGEGQIVIDNASSTAILRAQGAFAGAAEDFGVSSVEDVQSLVDEVRYGVDK